VLMTFSIPGPPRTKKNSPRPVNVGGFMKVLPSKAYCAWFKQAMTHALLIRTSLQDQYKVQLPITNPVIVFAKFYLDRNTGPDENGLMQALGDFLQAPKFRKLPDGRLDWTHVTRDGCGVIDDDNLIRWKRGIEIHIDRQNPRIEVELEVLS
jgi:hypothetical protein